MNRKMTGTILAVALATVGTVTLTSPADATGKQTCTLQYHLSEDGTWDGGRAGANGVKLADFWRVNDYRLAGTVTPDQYGRMSLNVAWTPGYNGIPCKLVRVA